MIVALIFFAVAAATFVVLQIGYLVTRAIESALAEDVLAEDES